MFKKYVKFVLIGLFAGCHPVFADSSPAPSIANHKGIYLIHVYGKRNEMFAQYANLVRSQIHQSTIPFYGNKIIKNIELNTASGILGSAAKIIVNKVVYPRIKSQIPAGDLALYQNFADQVGLDRDLVVRAFIFPDMGEYLVAKLYGKQLISEYFQLPPMGFGCTSFVAQNGRTHGKLIHARNLDYFGLGAWEKMQTVTYFHTTEPNEVPYAGISSLGSPMAAPTAFNQAGIIIDLHQSTVDEVALSGTPIISVFDYVIRHAHTLDEAISLFRSFKYTTPWKIIVSSINEGKSATVEVSAESVNVHSMASDILVETNHVRTASLKAKEFSPGQMYAEDSVLRERNVLKMLNSKPTFTVQDAVDTISNSVNWAQGHVTESAAHGIMARINNVQSLVFSPDEGVVYMGMPPVEFAKPTEGEYVPVSLNFKSQAIPAASSRVKSHRLGSKQILAQAEFRRANVDITEEGKMIEGLGYLERAMALDGKESSYPLMAGLTALKIAGMYWKENSETATTFIQKGEGYLNQASNLGLSHYHQSLASLFEARMLFGLGKNTEANQILKSIAPGDSKVLNQAIVETQKKGFRIDKFAEILLSLSEVDVLKF